MTNPLGPEILQNAQGPQSAQADNISVTQHNLKDQIAADKYLGAKAAVADPVGSLIFRKIVPPGAV